MRRCIYRLQSYYITEASQNHKTGSLTEGRIYDGSEVVDKLHYLVESFYNLLNKIKEYIKSLESLDIND